MKLLGTTLAATLTLQVAMAQTPLNITVVDATTNKPIAGATIKSNKNIYITDNMGNALTGKWSNDAHTVTVTAIGYQSTTTVFVPNNTNGKLTIRLKPSELYLEPLEVRATRASDKSPFTKTNISKAEIAANNFGQDLPFILNQTPGVVANSDAGNGIGYTGIRIRGTDATRINVTINGIPYNDAESQGTFFVNLPDLASSTNSIQIQRGVGTSTNGVGAFGATINLSTNEVNQDAYAELNNSYGSFNSWKNTIKVGSGLINNHFTIDARLSNIASDGFIDRASTNMQAFYLSGAYLNKKTQIRFTTFGGKERTYQAWNGIPEAVLKTNRTFNSLGTDKPGEPYDNQTDNYQQTHYQLFVNQQLSNRWSLNVASFYVRGKGYYEEYRGGQAYADYFLANPRPGTDETDLIRQLWLDNHFYGQNYSAQYKDAFNEITLGGTWSQYDGKHYGRIIWAEQGGVPSDYKWYNLTAFKSDRSLFAKWQRNIKGNWYAFADLQYRSVRHTMNGFRKNPTLKVDRSFDFINPKAGISYQKNGYNLYVSYAVANKEPNRDDFEAGATNQPTHEQLQDVELGIERKTSKYSWGATFYYMHYRNQLIVTGQINDVGAYNRVNVPNSYRMGLELQGSYQLNHWLQANANIALSQNKIKQFTEYIDNYDAPVFKQEAIVHKNTDIAFSPNIVANYQLTAKPIKNISVALPGKYVGRQYLDNTQNEARSLQAFFVQDIRLSYQLPNRWAKSIQLSAQVNNVFNRKYEPNGYTFSYIAGGSTVTENFFFPMAGTNYMLAVNISL